MRRIRTIESVSPLASIGVVFYCGVVEGCVSGAEDGLSNFFLRVLLGEDIWGTERDLVVGREEEKWKEGRRR